MTPWTPRADADLRTMSDCASIWRRYDADERRLTGAVSERMLDLGLLRPGMQVLDIATGRGEPAIRAAKRVAPNGAVLGVDVAAELLAMAAERAADEDVTGLELRVADAHSLEGVPRGRFDVALARWGLMYFDDPIAALDSIRLALRPGGRLVAAFWAEPELVDYIHVPRSALASLMALPPIDEDVPGTFRYAHRERIERDLASVGFLVNHVEERWTPVMEASTDDELIAWTRSFGMQRLLVDLPDPMQRAWERRLIETAEPLWKDGRLRLGGVTRLVVADRPG
ncbi:MAG: class I SAM-dependent methyltransferase [Phycisphaerae bacterium]|jgi:ubiquinone/menaquinone biosynthesis C-methylase UbiE|nr:class I SAM-dependent methyltransferase [Phycisphaerae bacterium]